MNISNIHKSPFAKEVWFEDSKLFVLLDDGRELGIPIEWFDKLKYASKDQLNQWKLIGKGEGVHWDEIDEDILIEALL